MLHSQTLMRHNSGGNLWGIRLHMHPRTVVNFRFPAIFLPTCYQKHWYVDSTTNTQRAVQLEDRLVNVVVELQVLGRLTWRIPTERWRRWEVKTDWRGRKLSSPPSCRSHKQTTTQSERYLITYPSCGGLVATDIGKYDKILIQIRCSHQYPNFYFRSTWSCMKLKLPQLDIFMQPLSLWKQTWDAAFGVVQKKGNIEWVEVMPWWWIPVRVLK